MCVMPRAPPPDSTRPILGRSLAGGSVMAGVASLAAAAGWAWAGSASEKITAQNSATSAIGTNRGFMLLACYGRQPAKNHAAGDARSRARALDSIVGSCGDYSGGRVALPLFFVWQSEAPGFAH